MPIELFRDKNHACLMFTDLVEVSNKVLRLWVRMARQLDIAMLVPQHGAPIEGRQAIADFFDWLENLACGIDLMGEGAYQLPGQRIETGAGAAR